MKQVIWHTTVYCQICGAVVETLLYDDRTSNLSATPHDYDAHVKAAQKIQAAPWN